MAQEVVGPHASGRPAEPLSAPYWTRLANVRLLGTTGGIDLVLIGPSGVHVVIDRPAPPTGCPATNEADAELEELAQRAGVAAAAVAELLPLRYRHVVTAEISLSGLVETEVVVGVVLAASPDVLRHVWRHRPWALSTSEAAVIANLLHAGLEPIPVETAARPVGWWRSRRWVVAGAAALAGVAATVAVAVTGIPMP